ncbi:TPA_asm: coat protein [Arceuthobium sichuanense virus 8]|nr:TPA_asm: coat protein [Arceuthobium sichuanense virus 8]
MANFSSSSFGPKRPRVEPVLALGPSASGSAALSIYASDTIMQATPAEGEVSNLVPRAFERLSLSIDPKYVDSFVRREIAGHETASNQRVPTARYYTLSIDAFRSIIENLLRNFLSIKYAEKDKIPVSAIEAELDSFIPVTVDACCSALYSKLRNVHKQYGQYSTRYPTPPTYAKEIELPLPLADAIQNFGVFKPRCINQNYICIPLHPENMNNEGRGSQNWSSFQYEAYKPILRDLGIPLKSVDTRIKSGTAWWTYRPQLVNGTVDLRCIFPPINYSDHSALVASMFVSLNSIGDPVPLIQHLLDDSDYPVRLREINSDFPLNAFSSLCHAPSDEWTQYNQAE